MRAPKQQKFIVADRGRVLSPYVPFAAHRSNSYYHEVIVDLGYFAPLHYLVRNDPNLRLLDFAQLMQHRNVPMQTREAKDPLLITLRTRKCALMEHRTYWSVGLLRTAYRSPWAFLEFRLIAAASLAQLERHVLHAIEFIEDGHYERHWGFDNCVIPFLFTREVRKDRAMQFVRERLGSCPFLLFKTIPDLGLLRRFPRPDDYALNCPAYRG